MVLAVVAALLLSGCDSDRAVPADDGKVPGQIYPVTVTDSDGRPIRCVVYRGGYGGSITCDWTEQ